MDIDETLIKHAEDISSIKTDNLNIKEKVDYVSHQVVCVEKKIDYTEHENSKRLHEIKDNMATNKNVLEILEALNGFDERLSSIETFASGVRWIFDKKNRGIILGILGFFLLLIATQVDIDVRVIKDLFF